jgi:hypothetical protein
LHRVQFIHEQSTKSSALSNSLSTHSFLRPMLLVN